MNLGNGGGTGRIIEKSLDPPKILYEDFIPVFFLTSLPPFPSFLPTFPGACPFSLLHCHDVARYRHRGGHLTRPSVSRGKPGTVGNVPCHYTKGADNLKSSAFVAASRRKDRSLDARLESAYRASILHKQRTGKALKITKEIVENEAMYEEVDERLPERQILMLQAQNKQVEERFQRQLISVFGSPNGITQIRIPSSDSLGQTRIVNCTGYSFLPSAPATTATNTTPAASVKDGSAASSLSLPTAAASMLEPPLTSRGTLESDLSTLAAWQYQDLQKPSMVPKLERPPYRHQSPSCRPRVASAPQLPELAPFAQGNPVQGNDTTITHGDRPQSEPSGGECLEEIVRPSADLGLPKGFTELELEIQPETTRATPEMDTPRSSKCPPTSGDPSEGPSEVHDQSTVMVWTEDQDPELNHFSQLVWGLENDSRLTSPGTDNLLLDNWAAFDGQSDFAV